MADRYTSKVALVLDAPVASVGDVVDAASASGDIDRAAPVRDRDEAMEVHWAGRMDKAVVRRLEDDDGRPLLRTETYLGRQGLVEGMRHQALLLQALSRQLKGRVTGVRDLEAMVDRDEAWMNRLAIGAVERQDAIVTAADGEGTWWVRTHGAARFDIPDIELYGLSRAQVEPAERVVQQIVGRLLDAGLRAELRVGDTAVYLVPVLEAWPHLNLDWPGVGRADKPRGPGLDGPRATLSILHKPRFGRYRKDFKGVLAALDAVGA